MPSAIKASQPAHEGVTASLSGLYICGDPAQRWTTQQYMPGVRAVSDRTGVLRDRCRTSRETSDFRVVRALLEVIAKAKRPPVLRRVAMVDLDVTVIDAR